GELLVLNDELRELIIARAPARKLKEVARANGTLPLREAAMRLVNNAETSLEEINRVPFVALQAAAHWAGARPHPCERRALGGACRRRRLVERAARGAARGARRPERGSVAGARRPVRALCAAAVERDPQDARAVGGARHSPLQH